MKSSSGICTILSRTNWKRKRSFPEHLILCVRERHNMSLNFINLNKRIDFCIKSIQCFISPKHFNAVFRTAGFALKWIKSKTPWSSLQFISSVLQSQVFEFTDIQLSSTYDCTTYIKATWSSVTSPWIHAGIHQFMCLHSVTLSLPLRHYSSVHLFQPKEYQSLLSSLGIFKRCVNRRFCNAYIFFSVLLLHQQATETNIEARLPL